MDSLKAMESPQPSGQLAQPGGAGRPGKRSRRWVWLLLLVIVGAGVWYFRSVRAANSVQNAAAAKGGGGRGGNPVVPVVVATAEKGDLPVYLNGLGNVSAFNTVIVRSRVDGQIISVAFKEGQFVQRGSLLVQIDPRPFEVQLAQAQGQLAKDQAQLHDAMANAARFDMLFKEGVIPQQQRDTQQAAVGQFEGAIKSDQAQIASAMLQLTYSRITAPISGRVGFRLVDPGNIIHASDAQGLLLINQVQPVAVLFSLPEDQLAQVNSKLRAGVQLSAEAYDRDNTTKIATGKLLTIDNQIDPTTGTYKLKAVFDNSDNALFPNQFVNVHLLVETKKNLTIVPAAALQRGPQGIYVYVVGKDSIARIQSVTLAQTAGNNAGLSAGISPGDVVVIDGQDKLQDNTKIDAHTSAGGGAPRPGGQGK
ncbi:MAG TPA: MdtA/MuxA family multidrug efflux RND transporter periplasmic adaptor subunit [Candidatus Acidoferrum sp.]|nr:MdtA/MuxA family multidrug efflux RND transporter periplasmic adaptor subunit [Candidatus Acidoferrum sp.]